MAAVTLAYVEEDEPFLDPPKMPEAPSPTKTAAATRTRHPPTTSAIRTHGFIPGMQVTYLEWNRRPLEAEGSARGVACL